MDFIPIQLYTPIYYHILLVVVLFTFILTQTARIEIIPNISRINYCGELLFAFVILYMGLRPISGVFIDMKTYAYIFERFQDGHLPKIIYDPIFNSYVLISSKIMSAQFFFFTCTLLYVVPLYFVSKKWFGTYWFYAFLFIVGSFSFWAYGVNGIRNGIASSFFLLGISKDKRVSQIFWIMMSVGFHKSMMLPAVGFIISQFYNNTKGYIIFWLFSIPLSLLFSGFWGKLFAGLVFIDDKRISYFITKANATSFSSIGFRWDFLVYSSIAIFAGWYYIIIKKFNDKVYHWIFNTYVFANAFWILVIRANYSNRFAYLSWFMMAAVIIYPLLKEQVMENQLKKIGFILLGYYSFTYIMGAGLI